MGWGSLLLYYNFKVVARFYLISLNLFEPLFLRTRLTLTGTGLLSLVTLLVTLPLRELPLLPLLVSRFNVG